MGSLGVGSTTPGDMTTSATASIAVGISAANATIDLLRLILAGRPAVPPPPRQSLDCP